eukprot:GHVS01045257.1.p1 GENE.GHVS01045257.1~~GHVS01045257.1.p1  ORF type:complete len:191 (-),score=48.04 GHVS01045257.1:134-706(-)
MDTRSVVEEHLREFQKTADVVEHQLEGYHSGGIDIVDVETNITELKDYLASYRMELQHSPPAHRKQDKEQLDRLSQRLNEIRRRWLLTLTSPSCSSSSSSTDLPPVPEATLRRARTAVERLERGSSQLSGCREMMEETEEMGRNVLEELKSQREVIKRTKERTRMVGENIDEAEGIVSRMHKWWHSLVPQ